MQLDQITPVILTWNEEPNLSRCLERLRWASQVVIIDSGSSDSTAKIASLFPNVKWCVRPFDDHKNQWNFGLDSASTEWILSLDADYVLGEGFEIEIANLENVSQFNAYLASFRYLVFGKPLRSCLYPPRAVLFRKDLCRYITDGHTQLLDYPGPPGSIRTVIDHDDRKPLSRWLLSQDKYAQLEADKLYAAGTGTLRVQDRLRVSMWAAIPAAFLYTLIVKGGLWDGWRGWYYVLQRVLAEMLLALRLIEKKVQDEK